MKAKPKISQIIPATDWYVVYSDEAGGKDMVIPLVCWVLVEEIYGDDVNRYVDAIDYTSFYGPPGSKFCSKISNFKRFQYDPERRGREE